MSKTMSVSLTKPVDQVLKEAAQLLQANGVNHQLSETGGSFSSDGFEGTVRFANGSAVIEITKKPMMVPWFVVESKIRSYFA